MLYSFFTVRQSQPVTLIHISPLFWFSFTFRSRAWSPVACTLWQVLLSYLFVLSSYLFYTQCQQCQYVLDTSVFGGVPCAERQRASHVGSPHLHPVRRRPTAPRASDRPEEAVVALMLNNTLLTRQVVFWAPVVTTQLRAGSSWHCFHLLLMEWMQRR